MRLNVSCAPCQIIIWGDFSFWAERLRLRASHLGGGREYIVVHLHSYSYKISHSLHEISQSSLWVFFQFRSFGMLGFCTTDQKQRR